MKKVAIFLDSGAPTIYNNWARAAKSGVMGASLKNRQRDDHSYLESDVFLLYRENYVKYIKEHEHELDVYANLDVINNAEATYANQKWMEEQGLHPLPVWHFGTDESYLVRYLEEGYKYLAIGGLIPNHVRTLIPALDRIWRRILTDKQGMPKIKVHGFALTSAPLVRRYPWFSVDSSSWTKAAAYGKIYIPPLRHLRWDWSGDPILYPISEQGRRRGLGGGETEAFRQAVRELIVSSGFVLGVSEFEEVKNPGKKKRRQKIKETIIEEGVTNSYLHRAFWNAFWVHCFVDSLPDWPWAFLKPEQELL